MTYYRVSKKGYYKDLGGGAIPTYRSNNIRQLAVGSISNSKTIKQNAFPARQSAVAGRP